MFNRHTLTEFLYRGSTSILDTLSEKNHSPDFAHARNHYLGNRLRIVCGIFILLSPFWTLFDHLMLPAEVLPQLRIARLSFFLFLILIFVLSFLKCCVRHQTKLAIALLLSPALFYAYLIFVTASYELPQLGNYQFIPFLLVATLSIFPFTLIESLIIGCLVVMVQLYSFYIDPADFNYLAQQFWLLCALLIMAVTANHFHLNLLLRLYRQATHDPLTGLLNRHALLDLLTQYQENTPHTPPLGVMLLDLDHFKAINDQYGHAIGDEVLRKFAELLRHQRHPDARIARYGGEEFLLVYPSTHAQSLCAYAEQIRQQTTQLNIYDRHNQPIRCSVSIGCALAQPNEPLTLTIQKADEALYLAKRLGRNQVQYYMPTPPSQEQKKAPMEQSSPPSAP